MSLKFVLLFSVLFCRSISTQQNKYDPKYFDTLINNERILKVHLNCVLDKGPCTDEGQGLKKLAPVIFQDGCMNCPDKLKEGAAKIVNFFMENRKDWWQELVVKYDPDRKFKGIQS